MRLRVETFDKRMIAVFYSRAEKCKNKKGPERVWLQALAW